MHIFMTRNYAIMYTTTILAVGLLAPALPRVNTHISFVYTIQNRRRVFTNSIS